jgi:hypothetical protein
MDKVNEASPVSKASDVERVVMRNRLENKVDNRDIENEGWAAAKAGKPSSTNPYKGMNHYYWEKGYTDYLIALATYS